MSTPVYSTRFIEHVGLVGSHTYTVPPGFIAVLRDLDVYNGGGVLSTDLFLHGAAGQTIWNDSSSATPHNGSWRGRQVINAGETVDITTTGAWDVTLSGYLLTSP